MSLSSGWWWLLGAGFYGIPWFVSLFYANSVITKGEQAGFEEVYQEAMRARKRAVINLAILITGVLIILIGTQMN